MADEPGGWELKRTLDSHAATIKEGFDGVNRRLDEIRRDSVSRVEFAEYQRRIDGRLDDIGNDVHGIETRETSRDTAAAQGRRTLMTALAAASLSSIAALGIALLNLLSR